MYILDEVDAALDLSHTQNIGMMIRSHFASSQFIVVSLKEGIFQNSNVIFRTRFVDGVSAVTRTVSGHRATTTTSTAGKGGGFLINATDENTENQLKGQNQDDEDEDEEDRKAAPAKKRGRIAGGKKGTTRLAV
jgi:hypothetical protein